MSRPALSTRRQERAAWSGFSRFAKDARGATAIEYSMIAAGVALAIITIVFTLGETLSSNFYGNISTEMTDRTGG